jgi:hypothetical protein
MENDCADIPYEEWQVLISALVAVFQAHKDWFEEVRKQTHTPNFGHFSSNFPDSSRKLMSYKIYRQINKI